MFVGYLEWMDLSEDSVQVIRCVLVYRKRFGEQVQ